MAYCPRLHKLLLLSAALLFVVAPAQHLVAGMIVLAPVVDGHVTTTQIEFNVTITVTTNFPALPLGRPTGSSTQKPVLEFDLSPLAGKTVISATLELFTFTPDANPQFAGKQLLRGHIGDGIITPGDTGGTALRFFHQSEASGQPNDLDVTAFILGLPAGAMAGFSLDGSLGTPGSVYNYYSSEWANPDLHPRLNVNVVNAVPEPSSLSLALVGLTAMLVAHRHSRRSRR